MDVYLTEQELLKEEHLFAPHETSYVPLEGRTYEIDSLTEQIIIDEDAPKPPPSC